LCLWSCSCSAWVVRRSRRWLSLAGPKGQLINKHRIEPRIKIELKIKIKIERELRRQRRSRQWSWLKRWLCCFLSR